MKKIKLTRGQFAIVDDEDYATYGGFRWHAFTGNKGKNFYAVRTIGTKNGRWMLRLHRAILMAKPGEIVDHINNNSLDNRRANLRICSHAENMRNRDGANRNSKSGHRGVSWSNVAQKWEAQITFNRKTIYLGVFKDINDAIAARAVANQKYFGAYGGGL